MIVVKGEVEHNRWWDVYKEKKINAKKVVKESKEQMKLKGERMQNNFEGNKKPYWKWVRRTKQGGRGKTYDIQDGRASGERSIKMEGQEEAGTETITEIQNYLETFNKEIQSGDQTVQHVTEVQQVVTSDENAEEGTYFVDQSGHYYYQANADSQPVMTVVSGEATFMAVQPQDAHVEELMDQGSDGMSSGTESNQVILNAGDAYQAVTIVPSDSGAGEVSYVLIVQQPDDKDDKEDDNDLTVYDFDDAEEGGIQLESGDEDDKTKIIKILPKKSQTVTQAHMCNYCNYTSPKRYLLSRHMKSHSEERPHKCSVCERGFKTLASLQNHVNTHTGTKPHRCKFCDSAFTTSGKTLSFMYHKGNSPNTRLQLFEGLIV
uniref:C2H2-type domain-containing protein n=1 Tax=Timema genevievae TaxID=629358 RepID=A0A7R9PMA6_TIMGE|nr:unnamed protein product [Timema genevievae]